MKKIYVCAKCRKILREELKNKYPITPDEITLLCRELDTETGNWYKNRPMEKEANRALEYVYKNI